ncbi:hypothetical protein Rt10032_c06g2887 [Rhodotorula toruloides]|uniref:Uncharacterized protein n=1 Tax=Rhodotorula toruloides TaxID=5286 RepID=A0A511KER9_RHOTO|nr:hypothetical protein Rt10032_c06g2887 [Rhodotorula toruloides]
MAEDELDPAFLDLDSHAHTLDSLDSLGPGFGSSLDPFNDEQLDEGFGRPLGNELSGMDGLGDGEDDLDNASRSRHSSRTASTHILVEDARPQRHRDLMKELGLDDEDREGLEGSSSEGEADADNAFGEGEARQALSSSASPSASASDSFASPRRPPPRLHIETPASSAPTSSIMSRTGTLDGSDEDEEDVLAKEAEIDAALVEASSSLDDSIAAATSFLGHLRQHTTSSDTRASNAAAPSPLSLVTPSSSPAVNYADRQPCVEALAQSVLRSVLDLAQQREAEVRELAEAERVFARTDASWKTVLDDLEPLNFEEMDVPASSEFETGQSTTLPNDKEHEHNINPNPRPRSNSTSRSLPDQAHSELAALRNITASLLSALSSLSDITQMQSALASDAGRKLRALKAQVGGVKDDLLAVERSEALIQAFETREGTDRCGGRYSSRVRGELREVERRLDEGWRKAQEILAIRA